MKERGLPDTGLARDAAHAGAAGEGALHPSEQLTEFPSAPHHRTAYLSFDTGDGGFRRKSRARSLDPLLPRALRGWRGGLRRHELFFRHQSHLGNEAVASSGNGLYMPAAFNIAEDLSQRRDVVRQVALLDSGVGPYRVHEDVLGDQGSVILHQRSKRVEHLGPELHGLPVLQQPALLHLEAKRTKLVDLGVFHRPYTGDSAGRRCPVGSPPCTGFIQSTSYR